MRRNFYRLLACLFAVVLSLPSLSQTSFVRGNGPRAEWDTAKVILMHTPGVELFDGVIHPTAGLFEHYFDVDSAREQHLNYIRMLQQQGITVVRVEDVLRAMSRERLESLAAQVLTYDVSKVNPADSAANGGEYKTKILHEMSREDLLRVLMLQPTVKMMSVDNNTGIEATYTHRSLMNLYFTRDQSINTPRGSIICQMNSLQRSPETRLIEACYSQLGIKPILKISGDGRLEGGDYIPAGSVAFIGRGMRTNKQAIQQMMDADALGHDTIIVVDDHLRWQMEMHLDTHFNIIDRNLCTMPASRLYAEKGTPQCCTADIYARKPGSLKYRLIKKNLDFVELLKKRGFSIIPINREDEMHYANNYLTIAPRHIMAVGGQSKEYQEALAGHGVKVEWIPLDQLIKGYGAAHCMTQVVYRQTAGK